MDGVAPAKRCRQDKLEGPSHDRVVKRMCHGQIRQIAHHGDRVGPRIPASHAVKKSLLKCFNTHVKLNVTHRSRIEKPATGRLQRMRPSHGKEEDRGVHEDPFTNQGTPSPGPPQALPSSHSSPARDRAGLVARGSFLPPPSARLRHPERGHQWPHARWTRPIDLTRSPRLRGDGTDGGQRGPEGVSQELACSYCSRSMVQVSRRTW